MSVCHNQIAQGCARTISIATYNVHGCVGRDGRYNPERILAVMGELNSNILALQELRWCPDEALPSARRFCLAFGLFCRRRPNLAW